MKNLFQEGGTFDQFTYFKGEGALLKNLFQGGGGTFDQFTYFKGEGALLKKLFQGGGGTFDQFTYFKGVGHMLRVPPPPLVPTPTACT